MSELCTIKCYCSDGLHLGGHSCSCVLTWPLLQNTVNFHLVEHDRGGKSQSGACRRQHANLKSSFSKQKSQHQQRNYLLQMLFSFTKVNDLSFFKVSLLPFTLLWLKTCRPALIAHLWYPFYPPTCQDTFLTTSSS